MSNPMNISDLPHKGRSHRLEGCDFEDVNVSLIFFDGPPGSGPKLHRHSYAEVFIMVEGNATFTVGDDIVEAAPGQILIAQPNQPHKFINTGDGPLRINSIHNGPRFIQEDLEG
jgi:mannose-6-phosphate isomerase-like protein (cupin superfamily)